MELKELKPCDLCGGPINPFFFKLTAQQFMLDQQAIQRNMGLMQMMGGSLELANVFSPSSAMEKPLTTVHEVLLCQACFLGRLPEVQSRLELMIDPELA
ncbi:MAG: hypothetical protein AB7T38_02635 [Nitrospirales bacterium]